VYAIDRFDKSFAVDLGKSAGNQQPTLYVELSAICVAYRLDAEAAVCKDKISLPVLPGQAHPEVFAQDC
jgi:hypothetical protein